MAEFFPAILHLVMLECHPRLLNGKEGVSSTCQTVKNKLIGARSFNLAAMAKGEKSEPPTNEDGHGTHTASTAAGGFVKYADVLGNAKGTAVGMAPLAHLAIYKVCFGEDCPESDVLAALDAAVEEGVDVLSLSLGFDSAPFFQDPTAIGSFAAIQKGIFVSCSAGNSGPSNSTLSNEAPWILTVGASTIDRSLVATAKLGNGKEFYGESIFRAEGFHPTKLPLVYAGKNGKSESAVCAAGSLKDVDVKDKIVLCEQGGGVARIAKGQEVKDAGGAAMILINQETDGFSIIADVHVLPATHLSSADGLKIKAYINSTATPTATILFKGTIIGNSLAPAITSFSSRGPSQASPGILKPDIIGPGVNILAAWPFPLDNSTNPKSPFNIISGTSMSCPHLSGIAALLKSSHPYWSPAAIKSAIMTTADIMNLEGKAIDDETLHPADIFATEGQLNYPSFAVTLGPSQTLTRTVTNVGAAYSTYTVTVVAPEGVYVNVKPNKIYFSEVGQKGTYTVTFSSIASSGKTGQYGQGFLTWVSTKYCVRSPISVIFQ